MTEEDQIAQILADLLAALNEHNLERVATFYDDEFYGEDIGQARPQHGPAERIKVFASFIRAIPDVHFTGTTIVQGNQAALTWTMHGTHQGRLMRIPATGRRVAVRGVSILTFKDGKIVRGLNVWDMAGLLRNLGLLPEL